MPARRVYVIWTHPLFHDSARLLLQHPEILWVGSSSDLAGAREDIRRLQPDTIVIEETGCVLPMDAIKFLEEERRSLRIIGLSLESDQMSLYDIECLAVTTVDELLQIALR